MGLPWSLANTIASGASMEMSFKDLLARGAEDPVPVLNSFVGLLFYCPIENFMETGQHSSSEQVLFMWLFCLRF